MNDDEDPDGLEPADGDDPFDRLGYDTEREGDPFERLDDESDGAGGDDAAPGDGPWVPPGEDRRDAASEDDWTGPGSPTSPAGEVGSADAPRTDPGPVDTPATDTEADASTTDSTTVDPTAADPTATGPTTVDDPSDPFANVDTPTESPFDGGESVFERVDAGAADPDQVWESITGEDEGDDAERSVPDEGRYSDVSKHRFCEQCEHFSPPPDVSCSHHAAEIIEFLDMETVRLLDCPVVAEHEDQEEGG